VELKELLKEKTEELERLTEQVRPLLDNTPEGVLWTKKERGKTRYFRYNPERKTETYLGYDKAEEIKALETKNYLSKLVETAEKEKMLLEEMGEKLDSLPRWQNVFYEIPEEKKHMIGPLNISLDYFSDINLERWKMNRFNNRNNRPSANVTLNGEYVKSKSELIIADRLRCAGVPYHYEKAKLIADENAGRYMKWHPDFRVLNRRTGREYWWEHLGRMGDPEYFATNIFKLEMYAKNGIYPGDNLIITMESDSVQLGIEYVDMLIKRFLL